MKKNLVFIILIFSTIVCFAYSKPKQDDSVTVTGLIRIIGNEPFTFTGIVSDSGEMYFLNGDQEVLKELRKTQGKKIQIKALPKKEENSAKEKADEEKLMLPAPGTSKNRNLTVLEWKFVD